MKYSSVLCLNRKLIGFISMVIMTITLQSVLFAYAKPITADTMPPALSQQIVRLVDLLSDGYAVGYPDATMTNTQQIEPDKTMTFAVFTIEGFSGGNNHGQYLAVFLNSINEEEQVYYQLIDVIHIAGKSWRSILELQPKITRLSADKIKISIKALENTSGDGPNFPSKPTIIHLLLHNNRLIDVK